MRYDMLNERLKELRKYLNLSQKSFAERLGITDSGLSNLESGKRNLTQQMIISICREFNVNRAWLVEGVGDMFTNPQEKIFEKELETMTDSELQYQMELIQEERRKRSRQAQKTDAESWESKIEIRNPIGGKAQIFIDGKKVPNVIAYKIEQDCFNNRVPLLTLQVKCDVDLESGAIPLLPEPWSWYYKPRYDGFIPNPGDKERKT